MQALQDTPPPYTLLNSMGGKGAKIGKLAPKTCQIWPFCEQDCQKKLISRGREARFGISFMGRHLGSVPYLSVLIYGEQSLHSFAHDTY